MLFNLNDFLRSISKALDYVEVDLFGIHTNHSIRIALMALKIAKYLNLSNEEIFDVISFSMLHDNGISLKILHDGLSGSAREKQNLLEKMQTHCTIGEENICAFPFMTQPSDVIKYHHENYDGSGFFKLKASEIPLMAQIIHLADHLDLKFELHDLCHDALSKEKIAAYVLNQRGVLFSPEIADAFLSISSGALFWCALTDENVEKAVRLESPDFSMQYSYNEIRIMTKTFSKIIDSKSSFTELHSCGVAIKLENMLRFYHFDEDTSLQFLIAADLHDLGKLAISNEILDKPGALTQDEFEKIKRHPEISKLCLQEIKGFEKLTKWVYQHHEKLDGSGYPQGLFAIDLDFESRLLTCLDIYQALREKRPYRSALDHENAMKVLQEMADDGKLDRQIVIDMGNYFS